MANEGKKVNLYPKTPMDSSVLPLGVKDGALYQIEDAVVRDEVVGIDKLGVSNGVATLNSQGEVVQPVQGVLKPSDIGVTVAGLNPDGKIDNSNIEFGKVEEGDSNVVSGGEVFSYIPNHNKIKINETISSNIFNKEEATNGYYRVTSGGVFGKANSDNWCCVKIKIDKPENICIRGMKATPSVTIFLVDINNNVIYSESINNTEIIIQNNRSDLFLCLNIANVINIGLNPTNNEYVNSLMINYGDSYLAYEDFGDKYVIDRENLPHYSDRKIKIDFKEGEYMDIYLPKNNDKWVLITFRYYKVESKFIELWRVNEAHIVYENSDKLEIVKKGVWENAFYTSAAGYSDALGSSHGCEIMNSISFFADNKEIKLSGKYECDALNIFQNSFLKKSNGVDNIGNVSKNWTFSTQKDFNFKMNIKWLGALKITQKSYIAMLPVERTNANGVNISKYGVSNTECEVFDISEVGFQNALFLDFDNNNRDSITVFGDLVKIEMNVINRNYFKNKENKGVLRDAGMFVQNTDLYNKIYGSFGSVEVSEGDSFKSEFEVNFLIK